MDSALAHLFTESDEIDAYLCDGCVDSRFFNSDNDIVSRYQTQVDEDKLNDLAFDYINDDVSMSEREAFKAGYRKAMEE